MFSSGPFHFLEKCEKRELFCLNFTVLSNSFIMQNDNQTSESASPHPGGRPTKYVDKFAKEAYKICLLGATDAKLADFFEVAESTIYEWKKEHPKFSEAIKKGREIADAGVAQSLFKRATGYKYKDVDVRVAGQQVVTTPVVKEMHPEVLAQIFWLKNRRPDLWRDRQDVKHQFSGPVSFIYQEGPGNDPIVNEEPAPPAPTPIEPEPDDE